MKVSGLVIIGNGIAGITAARHVRKRSDIPITIISSESKYFFSRTALMYVYMGHMKYEHTKPYEDSFWEKNKITLIQDQVEALEVHLKSIQLRELGALSFDQLLIATGSKTTTYGWKGLQLAGVQGLYSLQDLQLMEAHTQEVKKAVVVGGGLIGVEMAEMLVSRGIEVDFLVRESRFFGNVLPQEEADLVKHQLQSEGVSLHFNSELEEIIGDESNRVNAIRTKEGVNLPCEFVGITTGVQPNVDFLKSSKIELDKGVLVNEYLQTNCQDIYAIGDCAQLRNSPAGRKSIEAVWYVGKMMGEVVAANLCGLPTVYDPGPWFNSAKFFNLEYQTYGWVDAHANEQVGSLLWLSEKKDQLLRLNFQKIGQQFIGVNAMGIRLNHRQCDHWLRNSASIKEVVDNLEMADFNPEFHKIPFEKIKQLFQLELKDRYQ